MPTAAPRNSFDTLLASSTKQPLREDLAVALGQMALAQRREEDALPILSVLAARAGASAVLLHIAGLAHRAVGDLNPAIALLDRALALTPDNARLVHARARAALEAGQDSLGWFARARSLAPLDAEVIAGQAAALVAARAIGEADALLSSVLTEHPGWLDGQATLARLRFAEGMGVESLAMLDKAIAGAPRDPRLHHLKMMILYRAADLDGAMAALADARVHLGSDPVVMSATAMLATEQGRLADADAAFARIVPLAAADTAVQWFRHLLRRGTPDALLALEKQFTPALVALAAPYMSLARRMTNKPAPADDHVHIVDLGADWPLLAPLADTLRSLHVTQGQPLDQSVRGGTQTDGPLMARLDPVIQQARAALQAEVDRYIALSNPKSDHFSRRAPRHPRFVGSWSVRLRDGGYHVPHIHDEGWLSSAFYVALPPGIGEAEAGCLTIGEPPADLRTGLSAERIVEPRPGRLVLFPSTSWHGTLPFAAGERLTMAFDIA